MTVRFCNVMLIFLGCYIPLITASRPSVVEHATFSITWRTYNSMLLQTLHFSLLDQLFPCKQLVINTFTEYSKEKRGLYLSSTQETPLETQRSLIMLTLFCTIRESTFSNSIIYLYLTHLLCKSRNSFIIRSYCSPAVVRMDYEA